MEFVNIADEIKEAFEPYYEAKILDEEINPNLIYDTRKLIRDFGRKMKSLEHPAGLIRYHKIHFLNKETGECSYLLCLHGGPRFSEQYYLKYIPGSIAPGAASCYNKTKKQEVWICTLFLS